MEPQEIKDWRKAHGIRTQAGLGQLLGVSRIAVTRWETGVSAPQPYLDLALEALEIRFAAQNQAR